MHFVVIGGTGGIGRWVVRRLHQRGHQLTVMHRGQTEAPLPRGVVHLHGEVRGVVCDAAIHMYAMSQFDAEQFVHAFRGRADRLLAVSSGDVYRAYGVLHRKEQAALDPNPLTEDSPLRTIWYLYPQMPEYDKIPVERVVMQAGNRNCVLRLPAVYGPEDSHHRAGGWLKRISRTDEPVHLETGFANWRWTHGYVENVAEAIALAAVDVRSAGRLYNVGEVSTPAMAERIAAMGRAIGWQGCVRTTDEDSTLDYRQHLVIDSGRIRSELGFTEVVCEQEAIARTIAWEIESGYVSRPS